MKRIVKTEPEEEDKEDKGPTSETKQQLVTIKKALLQMKELCCCPICYDFYHAPVMFPKCGHTFCSLCVRQALMFKDECPSCRIEARTNDLVPVRLVEGMSVLCQKAAVKLFDASADETAFSTWHDGEQLLQQQQEQPKRKRQKRMTKDSSSSNNNNSFDCTAFCDGDNEEQLECPTCKIKIRVENMEKHERVCLGKEEGRAELGRLAESSRCRTKKTKFSGDEYPQKRIPLLAYSVLSDKTLRKKCDEYGLPSRGSRALREKRLKEYINRYNAECDSDNPKTIQEILNDVTSAENEYKLATKTKEKKDSKSRATFHKLFEEVMTQKQEQKEHKGEALPAEEDDEDSQQTQMVKCASDNWSIESQHQQECEEQEQDILYTQLN